MFEHFLPNRERFNKEESFSETAEKLTVEDWEILTIGWNKGYAYLAKITAERSPEQRQDIANKFRLNVFFGTWEDEDGGLSLLANICSLSDEALGRLNTALRNNEQEGLLFGPSDIPIYE